MIEPSRNVSQRISGRESAGLAFQHYVQVFLKRKWLVISALVVVTGAAALWGFSAVKVYRATSSVLVELNPPQVLGSKVREVVDLNLGLSRNQKSYLETQTRVVTSMAVMEQVSDRLGLAKNEKFWGQTAVTAPTLKETATHLSGMVSAIPAKNTNILEISVDHTDPSLAATLANAIAQAYMDQNLGYKMQSSAGAAKWLADQLDDLTRTLESADMGLYSFKKENNILSVSLEDKRSLIAQRIFRLNEQLTETQMKRISISSLRKQVQAAINGDKNQMAVDPVQKSEAVKLLHIAYVQERRKYAALLQRYLSQHPLVLEQKAQVDAARKDLEQEIGNILAGVEAHYNELKDTETQLAAALQTAKDEGLELNKREVEYRRRERHQKNTEELYGVVLTRMKESDLSSQLRTNNLRWLDQASVPGVPIRPRIRVILFVGALLGLLFGLALAFSVELLDNTVKSKEDIESIPDLVFLGLLPKFPNGIGKHNAKHPQANPDMDLLVHRNSKSSVAESCRAIRTNLLFASPDRPMKKFLITSAGPREGKTTTTVSLAIAMAQAGNRVIVVDTDMRRPRMHRIFGVPGSEGVTSVLLGDAHLDQVIKSTEIPDLFVLPCGPNPPNPAELCQSERFKNLLNELGERFDRVILDSPPVMVVTDAVLLSTLVDGSLLMARTGRTGRTTLRDAASQLRDVGASLVGCVLNDMDLEQRSYGYYRYRRYGYYRYGYYRYGHYGDNEEEATTS
ncbi:MAG: polysaccharide biosynthesis tyrosine autokinase [Pseudomonadota bacterium]